MDTVERFTPEQLRCLTRLAYVTDRWRNLDAHLLSPYDWRRRLMCKAIYSLMNDAKAELCEPEALEVLAATFPA